jgi:hypothetical protein
MMTKTDLQKKKLKEDAIEKKLKQNKKISKNQR